MLDFSNPAMATRSLLRPLVIALSTVSSTALAAPPLPSLPGGASDKAPAAAPSLEQLRRGVVQIEQGGRPMAVGTVLQRDGRILTALSALNGLETVDVRYADNSVVKSKIGHKDKDWDLALLIPQSGRWLDGLMPTDVDLNGVDIKAFLPKGGKLGGVPIGFRGLMDVKTREGDPLRGVLDLDFKGLPQIPGAPVLEPNGKVVGVLAKACKPTASSSDKGGASAVAAAAGVDKSLVCAPVTMGVPVKALRAFLMKTPAEAIQPAPWLGLGGAPSDSGSVKGVKVMGVAPGSPAEKAGLKPGDTGDTIVAVDGSPVETPEQLAELISKRAIGQGVKLLVFSQGKFREATVTLRPQP